MFVLDALRQVKDGELTIPSFHLGHLGFLPGLDVDSYSGVLQDGRIHELTLTPFQGSRDDLFVFKCIFKEQPGVVAKALSAFARMNLNLLSLESATIAQDTKHVLFCILSWAPFSTEKNAVHLDDGTKSKFIDLLPLLPTFDKRYVDLLETFIVFCFDAVDFEEVPGRKQHLPRISMKLFDDLHVRQNLRAVKILRRKSAASPPDANFNLPSVYIKLPVKKDDCQVLLFSETETKALHVIFPNKEREKKFLHIGFTHQNRPGALLQIATLLEQCGFSIKTSLLRPHDKDLEINVWETMLEYVGPGPVDAIPQFREGLNWFRRWCFDGKHRHAEPARQLVDRLHEFEVKICRPSYPRFRKDTDNDFQPIDWLPARSPESDLGAPPHRYQFANGLSRLNDGMKAHESRAWLANLLYPAVMSRLARSKGQVFISMPIHCKPYLDRIRAKFRSGLNLETVEYLKPDSAENVAAKTVDKIKNADFFLGIWHPELRNSKELSPWMPFELGVARAFGKPAKLIAHSEIPLDVTSRIMKDFALMQYDDESFDVVLSDVINACGAEWGFS